MGYMKTLLASASVLAVSSIAASAEKWDMPMAYSDSNYHTQNGKMFADAVKACTDGELEITVHGGGSLFKGGEIKRAVQRGTVQIGERLLSAHANEDAAFGFDSVPFLATSFDASDKLYNAAKPTLEETMDENNLVLLYAVPWPPQGLYAKKEVNGVEDLEGVKFRAYNAATARLAELAKMIPVQIEAAELTQALATGVAEAFVSSGSTGYDRKVWEQLTHFYDAQAWLPRNYVFVNKDVYNGASEKVQNCLKEAGAEAQAKGTAKAIELTDFYLKGLAENGMSVAAPGDKLKADLAEIGKTMADEWKEVAGKKGEAILEAYSNQ
ncbi:C4-dicarboxylate ABC transporter substrate-binding protein [Rhodobacteraceae bacterium RKSG542]|uniref:TRAP transporter substrate-binding protein n=1 Tax=Pseudovibrio flavus TaxID=2529854 RepID=UPI0012BD095F|nr:TRAP transporter substrate-binding protein [Pseudovibrio flavus]MTI15880.1 C4-dicarboxylate ABC transporter substrate-binding protein [Pseudovibrio flavus]